jgi:putative transposase
MVEKLKGRTFRRIQEEFPNIEKKYWGRHFWAIGFGVWSTGKIKDEMVKQYLEHVD